MMLSAEMKQIQTGKLLDANERKMNGGHHE